MPSVQRYRNFDPLTRDEADQLMLPNRRDGVTHMRPGDEWVAIYREQVRFHNNPREPIESADLIVGMNDDGTFYAFHSFGS